MEEGLFGTGDKPEKIAQDRNKLFVKIENFRSIQELRLDIETFTQIIGKNNSGKSNIFFAINKAVNLEKITESDFNDKTKGIKVTITHSNIDYVYTANKPEDTFKCPLVKTKNDKPIDVLYLPAFPDTDDATSSANTKVFGQLLKYMKTEKSDEIDNIIKEASEKVQSLDCDRLTAIKESLKQDIQKCGIGIKDIIFTPNEVTEDTFLKKRKISMEDPFYGNIDWEKWGHGTQRLLLIMMYLQLSRSKVSTNTDVLCLLEEPEIFMHPHQQRAIAEALYNESNNSNYKIVISTHSPFFINHMDLSNLRIVKKINGVTELLNDGKGLVGYSPSYNHINDTTMEEKSKNLLARIRLEPNMKEIFFADKVLVVEGYDEKIGLPMIIDHYSKFKLDQNNISIINTCGNCNLIHTAKALDDFSKQYIIVVDNDNNQNKSTNDVLDSLKKYFDKEYQKKVVEFDGDFCNGIEITDKTEYDVISRVIDIKDGVYKLSDNNDKKINTFVNAIIEKLK